MRLNLAKFFVVVLFVSATSYVCFLHNGQYANGIDDANIYFVYMRHLAHGEGFVYNAGGEHVEGFTSMLWCLWGAFLYLFTDTPEIAVLVSNVLFVSFCLWRLICFVDNYFSDRRLLSPNTLFLFFALFLFPGYFEWTVISLMETGLWSGLLILATLNLLRWTTGFRPKRLNGELCLLLSLLALTRPESLLYAPAFAAIRFVQMGAHKPGPWPDRMAALYPAAAFVTVVAVLTVFRLWYFGYPLPNTYYAKVSQDISYNLAAGYRYLAETASLYVPLVYAMPFVLVVGAWRSRQAQLRKIVGILGAVLLLGILVPLYSGGDHFLLGRAVQPTLPVLYAGAGLVIRQRLPWHGFYPAIKYVAMVFLLVAVTWGCGNPKNHYRYGNESLTTEFEIAMYGRILGQKLSAFFSGMPRYPSQGVLWAGALAYSYEGPTIDLLGLNNVAMAHADKVKTRGLIKNHASFNKDVFFAQKPDIMWLHPIHFYAPADSGHVRPPEDDPAYEKGWLNKAYKRIAYDPRFRELYLPTCIFKQGESQWLFTHVNKDFIPMLSRPPFHCVVVPHGQ